MTGIHEDPEDVRTLRSAQRAKKDDSVHLQTALKWLLSDAKNGWYLLDWLEDVCGVNGCPHRPGDPYTTAFNVGKQDVGRHIRQEAEASDPQQYARMLNARLIEKGDKNNG